MRQSILGSAEGDNFWQLIHRVCSSAKKVETAISHHKKLKKLSQTRLSQNRDAQPTANNKPSVFESRTHALGLCYPGIYVGSGVALQHTGSSAGCFTLPIVKAFQNYTASSGSTRVRTLRTLIAFALF